MKTRILSDTEKREYRANLAISVDYTDIAALGSGATGSVALLTALAIGNRVQLAAMVVNTPFVFSDASIVNFGVTLGDSGSATKYSASVELASVASHVDYSVGTGTAFANPTARDLTAAFTGTSAHSINTATAGKVTFYLDVVDLNALAVPQ